MKNIISANRKGVKWKVRRRSPEAESKEKHGVWDPMPELTITSPYVNSRDDSSTIFMGCPMPESTLTLCQSLFYSLVSDFDLA
jgi:hypothetical protein